MSLAPAHLEVIVKRRTTVLGGCLLATFGATVSVIHRTAEYESLTLLIGILALFAGVASAASP